MSARIELRIGELRLHGFGPVSGDRVAAVAERHLATLLAHNGLAGVERHSCAARLQGERITISSSAGSAEIGRAVAQAVYRGLAS